MKPTVQEGDRVLVLIPGYHEMWGLVVSVDDMPWLDYDEALIRVFEGSHIKARIVRDRPKEAPKGPVCWYPRAVEVSVSLTGPTTSLPLLVVQENLKRAGCPPQWEEQKRPGGLSTWRCTVTTPLMESHTADGPNPSMAFANLVSNLLRYDAAWFTTLCGQEVPNGER